MLCIYINKYVLYYSVYKKYSEVGNKAVKAHTFCTCQLSNFIERRRLQSCNIERTFRYIKQKKSDSSRFF